MAELTPREWERIGAALSAMLRYEQHGLDHARTDEAVERWAARCVETKAIMEKLRG